METIIDCTSIDLNKHGLIEASAGTGKTYTIEQLVIRIIVEKDVSLENVLIVTFTEKATGELKKRIRTKIEQELHSSHRSEIELKRLSESLTNFDSSSIYTIHGFCQNILRDFSFEQKQLFDFEVANDEPVYEKMLYEQMRKLWPGQYGSSLPEILDVSGFPDVNKMRGESQWINRALNIARFYRSEMNHRFEPEIAETTTLENSKQAINDLLQNVLDLVGVIDKNDQENSYFYLGYNALNFNKAKRNSILNKFVLPFLNFLNDFKESNGYNLSDLAGLFSTLSELSKASKESASSCLVPEKWNKNVSNMEEKCPFLPELVPLLDKIEESVGILQYMLVEQTIKQLGTDVSMYKMKNGLISFDDMLLNVDKALKNDKDGHLMKKLRDKYRYALVDEFQDTDSIQWGIFKKIFLEGDEQHLFLIGDPKQAIYSFRGADIYTYLSARREFRELETGSYAKLYSLGTNWRSGPGLVNAFNHLFSQEAWFGADKELLDDADTISYCNVKPSDKVKDGIENEHNKAPLTIVRLDSGESKAGLKQMAAFTANEIQNLINRVNIADEDDNVRVMNYGDVCVLVRSKAEATVIETALDNLYIPHTYYKKPGLYQSDEAFELIYLFRAIESGNDESALKKALLTPFFKISVNELNRYNNLLPTHPVKKLFENWYRYVLFRKWPQLFQSIIEDTGLIVRELQNPDGERKLTNYRHILQNLEELASTKNLDFAGIVNCLENYLRKTVEAEYEKDLHKIESEQTRVKIMTIHSSKGLEFYVVFLAGGFTKSNIEQYYKYNDNGTTVFDLAKTSYGEQKYRHEQIEENKRLYYVALTRAKYRLYIPEFKPPIKRPTCGPVSDIIFDSIQTMETTWSDNSKGDCLAYLDCDLDKSGLANEKSITSPESDYIIPEPTFPDDKFNYQNRMTKIESFSSLHNKMKNVVTTDIVKTGTVTYPDEVGERNDDETETNQGNTINDKNGNDEILPRGSHVGNMFHDILENLDYDLLREDVKGEGKDVTHDALLENDTILELIENRLIYNNINIENRTNVAAILWNTMVTPINLKGKSFMLLDLPESDKLNELEFHYPLPALNNVQLPEEVEYQKGFLTGFIDLVFRIDDCYYIADWKSNYIENGYSQIEMEKAMADSNYHLQYRIYTEAVKLWLKQCMGDKFNDKEHFGGVFYFFLRGIGTGDGNGIYFRKPEDIKPL